MPIFAVAEFPNDNPALHLGATWTSESPTGPVVAEVVDDRVASMVRELVIDLVEEAVAPTAPRTLALELAPAPLPELSLDLASFPRASPLPPEGASVCDDAPEPLFARFVRTLADVASGVGGEDAARTVIATLANDDVVSGCAAWRAIINGESEDFAACGAKALDEWAAELVAGAVAAPSKAEALRRELRSRGIAAFGLVV